jgi:hypothetical protein
MMTLISDMEFWIVSADGGINLETVGHSGGDAESLQAAFEAAVFGEGSYAEANDEYYSLSAFLPNKSAKTRLLEGDGIG